jgi:hypothetical protein
MSDALIHPTGQRTSPTLGGGDVAGFVASVVVGCALFAVDRKLTWGLDEPMLNTWLLLFALIPLALCALLCMVGPASLSDRDRAFVRYGRFSAVWMVSLVLYAMVHMMGLSRWVDEPIYESLGLSLTSFEMLTVIYVASSLAIVWTATILRQQDREGARTRQTARLEILLGAAIALPTFLLFVLRLPIQT